MPKKKYLILSFAVCVLSCSHKQKSEEEKERALMMKCHVSAVKETTVIFHLGIAENERLSYRHEFDKNGCKTKSIAYSETAMPERIMTREFDATGNLVCTIGLNPDSSLLYKEVRSYDETNNRKDLYFYLPDGTYKYRNSAVYDDKGKMTELKWYWPEGLKAINRYMYEGQNMLSNTEYGSEGELKYRWHYRYDRNNNLVEAMQLSPGGELNYKITRTYNAQNLLVKEENGNGDIPLKITAYEYNPQRLLTSKTEFSSGGRIAAIYNYRYEYYTNKEPAKQ